MGKVEDSTKKTQTAFHDSASRQEKTPLVSNKGDTADLTIISERAFASGISSGTTASLSKEENGQKD